MCVCVCVCVYLRWGLTVSPRFECSGALSAHCNLCLLSSSNSSASASLVAGIPGANHHPQLVFVFLVEMRFHHVDQAGFELQTSGDLPVSASRSAGITGVSHCARPLLIIFILSIIYESLFIESKGLALFHSPSPTHPTHISVHVIKALLTLQS